MRHESERGDILAGKLIEVLAYRRTLLRHPHDIGGRVLDAGDVFQLEQPIHGVDRHIGPRQRGRCA